MVSVDTQLYSISPPPPANPRPGAGRGTACPVRRCFCSPSQEEKETPASQSWGSARGSQPEAQPT